MENPNRVLKTVIVDDEPLARQGLEIRLNKRPDIHIVAQCKNGKEALEALAQHNVDLIFLDVQMPGLSGLDVLSKMDGDDMPSVIFVTAFDHYAINAFQENAVDYLLKPIEESRLHQAIFRVHERLDQKRAVQHKQKLLKLIGGLTGKPDTRMQDIPESPSELMEKAHSGSLSIKDAGVITRLEYRDITHIDAAGDYMCVHANGDTHILRATMKQLEEELNPTVFTRVHRSTIVNIQAVKAIHPHINGEHHLHLSSGDVVKLSRSYKDKVSMFT